MEYKIISNNKTLAEYNKYYFNKYPRRSKPPLKSPLHPSINTWFILKRPEMNKLKQRWKDYVVWLVDCCGYRNLLLDNCKITYKFYMPSKRRYDCDNLTPKFSNDGLTEAGVIVDDDYKHMNPLEVWIGCDKDDPRMEIILTDLSK